jgi:hypothetical protein
MYFSSGEIEMSAWDKLKEKLVPRSDAATALRRMPAAERLPKYRANSLEPDMDISEAEKDILRSIGRVKEV